jgi:hypothetical protein
MEGMNTLAPKHESLQCTVWCQRASPARIVCFSRHLGANCAFLVLQMLHVIRALLAGAGCRFRDFEVTSGMPSRMVIVTEMSKRNSSAASTWVGSQFLRI